MTDLYITSVLLVIVAVSYFVLWLRKQPVDYFRTCDYCGHESYIGTFKEPPKNQHWRKFACRKCGAELIHK